MPIPILILGTGLAISGGMTLLRTNRTQRVSRGNRANKENRANRTHRLQKTKTVKGIRPARNNKAQASVPRDLQAHQQYKQQTDRDLIVSAVTISVGAFAKLLYPPLLWVSVPLTLYSSVPIFSDTLTSFRKHRLNSSVIDSIAVAGSLLSHYYFASTLMSGLYFLSKKLQLETENDFHKLEQHQPNKVWLWQQNVEIEVPYDSINTGDIVLVNAGELIPFDGKVVAGVATIDEHQLTGHIQPLEKAAGDSVLAMTLLTTGKLQVQVEKTGQETLATQINTALINTPDYKDSVETRSISVADKLTWPTLALSGVALGTMGPVSAITVVNSNFSNAVSVFAPLGMLNYQKLAYQQGILIKDGRSLELLGQVDTVVFDKSMLLTLENPEVKHIHCWQDECDALELLHLSVAARGNLPKSVGKAIHQAATVAGLVLIETDNTTDDTGYGFNGMIEGRAVHIGSSHFMGMNNISLPKVAEQTEEQANHHGSSLIYVAINNSLSGAIELQANIRPEARETIQGLRRQGLAIRIITGDDEKPTQIIAEVLGVKSFIANMSSDEKARYIEHRQAEGESICFIGDSLNGTIAMKKAQVSIALSGASTVATSTANIVMLEDNLDKLVGLFDFADDFCIDMKTNMALALTPGALGVVSVVLFRLCIYSVMSLYAMTLALGAVNTVLPLLRTRKIIIMENCRNQEDKEHLSEQADKLIRKYAYSSSLTGFIPVPMLDIVGLMSVQRIMLYRMSVLYDVPFKKHLAKALLTTLMGSLASGVAAPIAGSALKAIPGVGTLVGGAGMATLGGASTYAIGRVFKQHFEEGGTLEDFDPEKVKEELKAELKKGKELSSAKKKKASSAGKKPLVKK